MKNALGIILIAVAIAFGYAGFNKITENTHSVELLGVKIEASDESAKTEGYIYVGIAIVLLAGGLYTFRGKK